MDTYKCNQTDYHGEIVRLRRHIEKLERLATQRGARMLIMREWIIEGIGEDMWTDFANIHNAHDWFDADGVPVREGK